MRQCLIVYWSWDPGIGAGIQLQVCKLGVLTYRQCGVRNGWLGVCQNTSSAYVAERAGWFCIFNQLLEPLALAFWNRGLFPETIPTVTWLVPKGSASDLCVLFRTAETQVTMLSEIQTVDEHDGKKTLIFFFHAIPPNVRAKLHTYVGTVLSTRQHVCRRQTTTAL